MNNSILLPGISVLGCLALEFSFFLCQYTCHAGEAGGAPEVSATASASNMPLFGASDFHVSPEHPAGWRGNWTGCYPGATNPPLTWGRHIKSPLDGMLNQARKPDTDAARSAPAIGSQYPYRYRFVREWLVVGTFEAPDIEAGFTGEIIPGEAAIEPDESNKVCSSDSPAVAAGQVAPTNSLCWKRWTGKPWLIYSHTDNDLRTTPPSSIESIEPQKPGGGGERHLEAIPETMVGLHELGGSTNCQAAYAHSYLYSREGGQVLFLLAQVSALKLWVNGKAVFSDKTCAKDGKGIDRTVQTDLAPGWNRILFKSVSKTATGLNFDLKLYPSPGACSYEANNIAWLVPMTKSGIGTPLVVGDRLIINTDGQETFCLDKSNGKVIWMRTAHPYYLVPDEEKKAKPVFAEKIDPLVARLEALNGEVAAEMNSFAATTSIFSCAAAVTLRKLVAEKDKAWNDIARMIKEAAPKYEQPGNYGGSGPGGPSSTSPCSDGKSIYSYFPNGETVAYDLDGNRRWIRGVPAGGRQCSSPAIVGGKLVVQSRKLHAFDAWTGAPAWECEAGGDYPPGSFESVVPARIGTTDVVIDRSFSRLVRASDGKIIWSAKGHTLNCYANTVILDDDMVYSRSPWPDYTRMIAVQLPAVIAGENEKQAGPKRIRVYQGSVQIPSPLYWDGLLYLVNEDGYLSVFDKENAEPLYSVRLPNRPRAGNVWLDAVYNSPSLAGKYLYITDNSASTVVFEAGREYKEVARNQIDYLLPQGKPRDVIEQLGAQGGDLVFDGNRLFLRGKYFLYCICKQSPEKTE